MQKPQRNMLYVSEDYHKGLKVIDTQENSITY